jgi:hypothetical protein
MTSRVLLATVCAAAVTGTLPAAATAETITSGMVIDGVTIVDTHDGRLTPNRELVLAGGKIARIVPAGTVKATGDALFVDGRGKFAVPGYMDMHAHPLDAPDAADSYALMIANGVTGFRQMSGSPEMLAHRAAGNFACDAGHYFDRRERRHAGQRRRRSAEAKGGRRGFHQDDRRQ